MKNLQGLIARHALTGIVVDSNLLVLLGVGLFDPACISSHHRTSAYDPDDFRKLRHFLANFRRTIVTPHILAELSNLTLGRAGANFGRLPLSIIESMRSAFEVHVEKDVLIDKPNVVRFGITDAGIIELGLAKRHFVLTDDLVLADYLNAQGADALNFNHIRNVNFMQFR